MSSKYVNKKKTFTQTGLDRGLLTNIGTEDASFAMDPSTKNVISTALDLYKLKKALECGKWKYTHTKRKIPILNLDTK